MKKAVLKIGAALLLSQMVFAVTATAQGAAERDAASQEKKESIQFQEIKISKEKIGIQISKKKMSFGVLMYISEYYKFGMYFALF